MGEDAELLPSKHMNLYSGKMRECIDNINIAFYNMSEKELDDHVKPSLVLYQLKLSFHDRTIEAQAAGKRVAVSAICRNICSENYFKDRIMTDPGMLAWMLRPVVKYEDKTFAALSKATKRYEDLIDMDITVTKRKKVDDEWVEYQDVCPKKALVLLSVIKNLEDRVKGTAIQRQINISTPGPKAGSGAVLDMDAVESKLKELESKLGGTDGDKDVREQTDSNSNLKDSGSSGSGLGNDDIGKQSDGDIIVEVK